MSDGDGDIMRNFYTNYVLSPPLTMGNVTRQARGNGPRTQDPTQTGLHQSEGTPDALTYVFVSLLYSTYLSLSLSYIHIDKPESEFNDQ